MLLPIVCTHIYTVYLTTYCLNYIMKFQNVLFRKEISLYYIVTDIFNHRLFIPISTNPDKINPTFIQILYREKGTDLVHLPYILHHKKV